MFAKTHLNVNTPMTQLLNALATRSEAKQSHQRLALLLAAGVRLAVAATATFVVILSPLIH